MFFFFNDTATTEIYTLSLHDALPISRTTPSTHSAGQAASHLATQTTQKGNSAMSEIVKRLRTRRAKDRKSTRLNSSHANISYAVFCLKKKKRRSNAYTLIRRHTNTTQ